MPIYDQSYRSWSGDLNPSPKTWQVIARTGIQLLWKKGMIVLLLFATIQFFVRAVQIYLVTRLQDNPLSTDLVKHFTVNPDFFIAFYKHQFFFLIAVLVLSGSALIANDRRVKALQLYFSKPVSFWDYVIGKWCITAFYGSLITIVPSLLLFVLRVLFATDNQFLSQYYWLPFSIIGYGILLHLVLGCLILAFSSLTKNGRSAAILFFVSLFFTDIVRSLFSRMPSVGVVSIQADLRQIEGLLFNTARPFEFNTALAAAALLILIAGSVLVIRMKVKPTEVVR